MNTPESLNDLTLNDRALHEAIAACGSERCAVQAITAYLGAVREADMCKKPYNLNTLAENAQGLNTLAETRKAKHISSDKQSGLSLTSRAPSNEAQEPVTGERIAHNRTLIEKTDKIGNLEFEAWWAENGVLHEDDVLRIYYKEIQWEAWQGSRQAKTTDVSAEDINTLRDALCEISGDINLLQQQLKASFPAQEAQPQATSEAAYKRTSEILNSDVDLLPNARELKRESGWVSFPGTKPRLYDGVDVSYPLLFHVKIPGADIIYQGYYNAADDVFYESGKKMSEAYRKDVVAFMHYPLPKIEG